MLRTLLIPAALALAAGLARTHFAGTPLNASQAAQALPEGVRAVWDPAKAYRETTPTRERVCLNGLWRWQPAAADAVPADGWGYFKVPGCWPGITDYMQKDSQTVFAHPAWRGQNLQALTAAWYQREIAVPANWAGRRIVLQAEYVNSLAVVYLDGKRVGEIRFPAGEVEVTAACRPGGTHLLSMRVVALPLKAVMLSHSDTNAAREVSGSVARRGLCGDVFLAGEPAGPRIDDLRIETSVHRGEITVDAALRQLDPEARYRLRAEIREQGRRLREFTSPPVGSADLQVGRFVFREQWRPAKLWDLHTPGNTLELRLSLLDAGGKALDVAPPARFGFREFAIRGRDFTLNGSRLTLSAVPLDNAQVGAALATYAAARESLERLKSFGINFVYTHNYGCEPGAHLSFAEILRAADDVGMLVALSQPHFAQYDWQAPEADRANGYAQHAGLYVRVAGNHPSVVAYSMSHNATGYGEDMNPEMIDGVTDPREPYAVNNGRLARRAEAIVRRLDPGRIVYHHSSGNLGAMHTVNFYANFVPVQEISDWFEHWATRGVKPVFLCEYGVPFSWDWAMYRGWYNGRREFGSAAVPWEFCLAEWNAQFLGDPAYRISSRERQNLRWEAQQFRAGRLWHRWDYPTPLGSSAFEERDPVFAMYLTENWRAFRTWGVSAISPWEYAIFWSARDGIDRSRKELPVDCERLQRPGFSPDYLQERYERMDLAFERADWAPTAAGQALLRNNRPLLAYIGGKPARFTSKDHNFVAGETVEKQLILINNSRESAVCDCEWSLNLPQPLAGRQRATLPAGEQARISLRFALPETLAPGPYEISATFRFGTGETQSDSFTIHVLPRPAPLSLFRVVHKRARPCSASSPPAPLQPPNPSTTVGTGRAGWRGESAIVAGVLCIQDETSVPPRQPARPGPLFTLGCPVAGAHAVGGGPGVRRRPGPQLPTHHSEISLWERSQGKAAVRIALFDPRGETGNLLESLCVPFQRVEAAADLSPYDLLIVGKAALTPDGPGPDVARVRAGLKVIVFEQTAAALEQRFGFRVAEYGLRQVFPRVPDHPLVGGLRPEHLRDWRGEATLLSPRLQYTLRPRYGPTVKWCGLDVPRVWRSGCRGNVASVLIEKPARGDFLPLLDGGYSLQYSPLLEYREGKGTVLFCQLDVTGRTERDPAAEHLARSILAYALGAPASCWLRRPYGHPPPGRRRSQEGPRRQAVYAGEPAGRRYLETAGIPLGAEADSKLASDRVLIVGPGGGRQLAGRAAEIRDWLNAGGRVTAIGLDQAEANLFLPVPVRMKRAEHIAAFFEPPRAGSPFAGIGPADVHNRDPREIPLVADGAAALGDGVLAQAGSGRVVFCQLAPWQFDPKGPKNVKRTFRRAAFLLSRLLGNMGVGASTPLLPRFRSPVDATRAEKRWLEGFYLDTPEEWDDPYRFFRW